jgi:two-component system chemotaxis sensor kinase CheA
MDMSKYQKLFFSEAREHLQTMSHLLLAMEKDGFDAEKTATLFRGAHSIKGMAATMGFARTAKLAHQLEDWLSSSQKKQELTSQMTEWLLEGLEVMAGLINDLEAKKEERDIDFFLKKCAGQKAVQSTSSLRKTALAQERPGKTGSTPKPITILIDLKEPIRSSAVTVEAIAAGLSSSGEVTATRCLETAAGCRLEIQVKTALAPDRLRKIMERIAGVEKVVFPFALSGHESPPASPARPPQSIRMDIDVLDYLNNITGELITTRHHLETARADKKNGGLEEGLAELRRQIAELQHQVRKIRMMPLDHITASLPRFVRDMSRDSGKKIQLEIEGENVELDRTVLEALADPLLHLLRNAVDHGIEKEGRITIAAVREQDRVIVRIRDNGKGMDGEAIRDKAARLGLATPGQLKKLNSQDILQLVCHPGFSTAQNITSISGRGIGMDIVKSVVNQLGGSLDIYSTKGQGTEMVLKIPLQVAIIYILLVEAGGLEVGIPVTQISSIMDVSDADLRQESECPAVDLTFPGRKGDERETELVPVFFLGELLRAQRPEPRENVHLVLAEWGARRVALGVEKILGKKEVFTKPLQSPLKEINGLSGATILGGGRLVFVLDIQSLLQHLSFSTGISWPAASASF